MSPLQLLRLLVPTLGSVINAWSFGLTMSLFVIAFAWFWFARRR